MRFQRGGVLGVGADTAQDAEVDSECPGCMLLLVRRSENHIEYFEPLSHGYEAKLFYGTPHLRQKTQGYLAIGQVQGTGGTYRRPDNSIFCGSRRDTDGV